MHDENNQAKYSIYNILKMLQTTDLTVIAFKKMIVEINK